MPKDLTREAARERITRILRGDGSPHPSSGELAQRVSIPRDRIPVPGLVLIAFTDILELKPYGPFEKMAWGIDSRYGERNFSVTLEKFGLRLYVAGTASHDEVEALVQALRSCTQVAECFMQPQVEARLNSAHVTLENQFHRFKDRCDFFRVEAAKAYSAPPAEPVVGTDPSGNTFTTLELYRSEKQGGYLASAMLDAYFSWLEHVLVLIAAFSDCDFQDGKLTQFVAGSWDQKYRSLFKLDREPDAKKAFDTLKQLKEELRNPASHGGFRKNGASFAFHSTAGALPVQLTKTNTSLEFHITPVPPVAFEDVCQKLDAVTAFLAVSSLSCGFRFAEAGLAVAFDPASRRRYQEAAESDDFDAFVDGEGHRQDTYANMDF